MYELRVVSDDETGDGVNSTPLTYWNMNRPYKCFGIYLHEADGRQMSLLDFDNLEEAMKAMKILNNKDGLREIAAVATIMSDHVAKLAYEAINEGYIAMAYAIGEWAIEFVHKYLYISIMEDGWENVMEDPVKYGFSEEVSCWDDTVMEFAMNKVNEVLKK